MSCVMLALAYFGQGFKETEKEEERLHWDTLGENHVISIRSSSPQVSLSSSVDHRGWLLDKAYCEWSKEKGRERDGERGKKKVVSSQE